ncbi:HD domain-containing protein [[Clostridium] symbiosum]|uniref:HD domain-containing protein n=1 Tax=Clostridium symbiosum TaxID=1512 RepID=UPI001D08F066|nr:HD domain-containing protein [[Clostridium] symbiosum]MCB6610222.1 HD family phosphohydrolase [[Clostridium] symbiosum]MCB6933557.1 HD family phosphohydrolase [[Clostridium] symbiosum]
MTSAQERIEGLLINSGRDGILNLIGYMRTAGFFTQPCSTQYHLAKEGGLAEHSLNVYEIMEQLRALLYPEIGTESVILCALLHDFGKCGQFGKYGYVPNMLTGRATKANPNPEPYQSPKKPYMSNPELLYVDHEVRSIQMAERYIRLTEEENWAILMHNGMYGPFKYQIQGKETPLYLLLHMADMWASRVVEREESADGESEV